MNLFQKRILPTFLLLMALFTTYGFLVDNFDQRTLDQIIGLAFFGALVTTPIMVLIWELDRPRLKRDATERISEKVKRQQLDILLKDITPTEMALLEERLQDPEQPDWVEDSLDSQQMGHDQK